MSQTMNQNGNQNANQTGGATPYDRHFFQWHQDSSLNSARTVLPLVFEAVPAKSLLDIGCGNGTWLKAAGDLGVADYMGVDGSYVDVKDLLIPRERFVAMDLEKATPLGRRFDLVMSLEVAEHISPQHADAFVSFVAAHGDVILFSAACPNQEGTDHRNEQWPAYWADKFAKLGYRAIDGLRMRLLSERNVAWWYPQNMLLYATAAGMERFPKLAAMPAFEAGRVPSLVHPHLFAAWVDKYNNRLDNATLKELLPRIPRAIGKSIAHRWNGILKSR
jgi:SAM-dependent methyltransferase